MERPTPRSLDDDLEPKDDADELWAEARSALALIGSVLLIVVLISLVGRLSARPSAGAPASPDTPRGARSTAHGVECRLVDPAR